MIIGAHSIIYSTNPEADRRFLRDILELPSVDVGEGWLIFGLPPAEVAVHPSGENDVHEFFLMCDDVAAFVTEMERRKIVCGPVQSQGWGLLTQITLPGGGKLGVYQPRHARPKSMGAGAAARGPGTVAAARSAARRAARSAARTGKKPAARAAAKPARRTSAPAAGKKTRKGSVSAAGKKTRKR
jgi:hypothetical protein